MRFFLFCLHPLDGFFDFYGITQHIQQVDDLHILIFDIFQGVFHPSIGLAAHVDEQVAVGDLYKVVSSGLIAVQVNAVDVYKRQSLPRPIRTSMTRR